jgi:hypothetical protein
MIGSGVGVSLGSGVGVFVATGVGTTGVRVATSILMPVSISTPAVASAGVSWALSTRWLISETPNDAPTRPPIAIYSAQLRYRFT